MRWLVWLSMIGLGLVGREARAGGGDEADAWAWCQENCSTGVGSKERCWGCFVVEEVGCRWAQDFPRGVFELHAGDPYGEGTGAPADLHRCDLWEHPDYGYVRKAGTMEEWPGFRLERFAANEVGGLIEGRGLMASHPSIRIALERTPAGDAIYKGKRAYRASAVVSFGGTSARYQGDCGVYYRVGR